VDDALALQEAELGDRDVGKLGAKQLAHLPDAKARVRRIRHASVLNLCWGSVPSVAPPVSAYSARNVSLYLPIWISSPLASSRFSTRSWLTKVPLRLARSSTLIECPSLYTTACSRETVTSS